MQKETLFEYIQRKIKKEKGDYKNKILFSNRILNPYYKIQHRFSKDHKSPLQKQLSLIENAIADQNGLGMLDLRLHNAHIPKNYYDIFYKLPSLINGGGDLEKNNLISIDCGAHAGLVSDILLQCGSKVCLFEPNNEIFALLENKYQNNPNVILNKAACGTNNSTMRFLKNGTMSQGNRLSNAGDIEDVGGWEGFGEYSEVKVVDLVEYLEKNILNTYEKIYFLKLDIEGAEFDIMDKIIAKKLYEKIEYIACETHERYFSDGKIKIQKLKEAIKANGIKNIFLDWI